MPCLFALIALLSPRLGLIVIVLWGFTNYVQRAFDTWFWPLLGLIFLPWTALMYLLVTAPVGEITIWGGCSSVWASCSTCRPWRRGSSTGAACRRWRAERRPHLLASAAGGA
jgi:hypothetical protein